MSMVTATVAVQMEFSGAGSGWTTVTDVLNDPGIRASYGITGNSWRDRVASTGTMIFELNNGEDNSGGKVGYYSPDHSNLRSGFGIGIGVRLAITYSATTYYKWRGTIESIIPVPGELRTRRVRVQCVDWMDEAAVAKVKGLAVQTDKRSDQVFSTILANLTRQPPATSVGTGGDTYPYALDNARDEAISVMSEFQRLASSELGYIFQRGDTTQGGTLVFEDRAERGTVTADDASFDDDDLLDLELHHTRDDIINRTQVQIHPRRVDTSNAVLFTLASTPQLTLNSTETYYCGYRDPDQRATRVGGISMVAPVASTDYTFNKESDGSGEDITDQLTVTATFGGNSAEVEIANDGPFDGYLTKLQLRGLGVYDYETIVLEAEDATSQTNYGESVFTLDMPYQNDSYVGQDAAWYILNNSKDAQTLVDRVTFTANHSATLMTQALTREISDRVGISEVVTGVDDSYHINAVDLELRGGDLFRCSWTLFPASTGQYWLLGTVGRSELGDTTILGYGLF